MRPRKRIERIRGLLEEPRPEIDPTGTWDTSTSTNCPFCGYEGYPFLVEGEPVCPTCGDMYHEIDPWEIIKSIRRIIANKDLEEK